MTNFEISPNNMPNWLQELDQATANEREWIINDYLLEGESVRSTVEILQGPAGALALAGAFLDNPAIGVNRDGRLYNRFNNAEHTLTRFGLGLDLSYDQVQRLQLPLGTRTPFGLRLVATERGFELGAGTGPIVYPPTSKRVRLTQFSPEHPQYDPRLIESARTYLRKLDQYTTREQSALNRGIYQKAAVWAGVLYDNPVSGEYEAAHRGLEFSPYALAHYEADTEREQFSLDVASLIVEKMQGVEISDTEAFSRQVEDTFLDWYSEYKVQYPNDVRLQHNWQKHIIISSALMELVESIVPDKANTMFDRIRNDIAMRESIFADIRDGTAAVGVIPGRWATELNDWKQHYIQARQRFERIKEIKLRYSSRRQSSE